MNDKIKETVDFLDEIDQKYKNPVLFCSFGKDSLCLLHLLLSHNIRLPLVYYTDPWFPRKNAFANRVIEDWNLEVHNYPPIKVSLCHGKEMVGLVSEYQIGTHSTILVLKNTLEYEDGQDPDRFFCGLKFLKRPCATFQFPWDVILIGHKSCDTDPIFGAIPLKARVLSGKEGPDYAFPLMEWTHDDVWNYIKEFEVPFQADRYDLANRGELSNKDTNSDWYPVCVRCVDRRLDGQTVYCPKFKTNLENIGRTVPEYDWQNWQPGTFSYSKEGFYTRPAEESKQTIPFPLCTW